MPRSARWEFLVLGVLFVSGYVGCAEGQDVAPGATGGTQTSGAAGSASSGSGGATGSGDSGGASGASGASTSGGASSSGSGGTSGASGSGGASGTGGASGSSGLGGASGSSGTGGASASSDAGAVDAAPEPSADAAPDNMDSGGAMGEAAAPCADCQLKVLVKNRQDGDDAPTMSFVLKVSNMGTKAIALKGITVRYWFTADSVTMPAANCDYAKLDCANVVLAFPAITPARPKADVALEVSFKGNAMLAPGANTDEIQLRVHDAGYQAQYTQTNDYSYATTGNLFVEAPKITAYVSGQLAWGTEP